MAENKMSLPEGFIAPVLFTSDGVQTAPKAPGVHLVIDTSGEIFYVGRTRDLRRRLCEHLEGDRQSSVLHQQVGEILDRPGHTASDEEIREWLTHSTVSWRQSDDPAGLKAELVSVLSPRFNRAVEFPRTGVWWVYQGRTYDQELAVGVVFAGTAAPHVAHHLNVGRMTPGDVVVHCRRGKIVAIGETVAKPLRARRPYGPPAERDEGWLTRVEYFPLDNPISLAELPERNGEEGPFNGLGQPKQGYLFPVESSFAVGIREAFADRWPVGSPWFSGQLAPVASGLPTAARWAALVSWAARFAESVDFDVEERTYKLEIRDRLLAARDAMMADVPEWPRLLRRAFNSPNNLTSWRVHGKYLDWVDAHRDEARSALLSLWSVERDVPEAVEAFASTLPDDLSGVGTRTNLASFLAAVRGVENYPVYRATAFSTAYGLTSWGHHADAPPGVQYADALAFLDAFADKCRGRNIRPVRDRLDAQGLLWQVTSGNPPAGWDTAKTEAYRRFLEGQTVDELAELADQFRAEVDYPGGIKKRRDTERAELAPALSRDGLDDPDVQLLRKLAGPAYGYPGPQPGYYALLQTDDGAAKVADSFRHLLYGPGDVAGRLDDCIRGEHKLPRVGEAIMTKALTVTDPERWFPTHVTTGKVGKHAILGVLGEQRPMSLAPAADAVASNDRIRELLDPYFPGDPWGIQEFTWWMLRRVAVPETPLKPLADELYLTEDFLARALRLLDDKGQVVFYGPPGTGKTYVARKLAGHIARGGGTVEKIQFHPSYAYEDFIEGYRPRLSEAGQVTYEVVDGPLKRIAAIAAERPDLTHVLLIDELNRANVSKVLGELMFLLEYREEEIRLQYSEAPFSLPANLQIIATMNTADRSIALVDTALRRRFHFLPFFPDKPPINSLLRRWLNDKQPELVWVADVVDRANGELADRNAFIGPSHFLKERLTEDLVRLAWEYSVLPFLEEYFFADPDQLERFGLDRLRHGASEQLASEAEELSSSDET
jgi:MoxR-like ATPase